MILAPPERDVCNAFEGIWLRLHLKGDGVKKFSKWMLDSNVRTHPMVQAGTSGGYLFSAFFEKKQARRVFAWCNQERILVTNGFTMEKE